MREFVHDVVRRRNWVAFVKHLRPVMLPIVREFYANFPRDDVDWVIVRKTQVYFNSNLINAIYELFDEDDNYDAYLLSLEER